VTVADVEVEGRELISALGEGGAAARLLGGVAIAQHRHAGWPGVLDRRYGDIDLVAEPRKAKEIGAVMTGRGYEPALPFNNLHGYKRLLFHDLANRRQVDVFVGRFEMCHALDLSDRLDAHPTTLSAADLLLTKLQVVQIDSKDLRDAVALVHQHELGDEADGDVIGVDRLVAVTRGDWGWWTTLTDNLARLPEIAADALPPADAALVTGRVEALRSALAAAPKSMRWRTRAKIGRRVPWYELPEEHGAALHE
jgi:hypothetical protein